ncbi:MAG: hypothetical protein L3J11_09870 [Draconibacterium sp.]|nr:hypothetical protein [Draconibacterium sp.]
MFIVATNFKGVPPVHTDFEIPFSFKGGNKPYIQSEGTPEKAPGGYWGKYSKAPPLENYINIGIYSEQMKSNQINQTQNHFENGWGYNL